MKDTKMETELEGLEVLAWVGEDELGSGKVGMKQIMTPKGVSALAAIAPGEWLKHEVVQNTMQHQANAYGKTIYLCKFQIVGVERVIGA